MKRFFPELTSCFSGGSPSPSEARNIASRRRRTTQGGRSRKNRRPALAAIEEHANQSAGGRSEKKPLIKTKLAGKLSSDSYQSDHRKSNSLFELPAYSPTPFVF